MTYNIHHGKGIDKKLDLNRIVNVISKSNADLIGLNEVDRHFSDRSDFVDQVQTIANELNFQYAFSPSLTKKKSNDGQYGNALLSRHNLVETNNHSFNLYPGIEGRSILEGTIEVNNKRFTVYVSHLSLHPFLHKKQSLFFLSNNSKPVIILGDWNMKPHSKKWKAITEKFLDVWNEAGDGNGYTYPATRPRMRLDYIFVTDDVQIEDVVVFNDVPMASDHLPVLTTLTI